MKKSNINFAVIAQTGTKEQLYAAVNLHFGSNFEVGSIDEFEDDEMRTQLETEDVLAIVEDIM